MPSFKVLRGVLQENGKTYKKGDVITTDTDLLKHNEPSHPRYAEVLGDTATVVKEQEAVDESLNEMSFAELKSYAQEGEVDITGATTKADLIAKIKQAESGS